MLSNELPVDSTIYLWSPRSPPPALEYSQPPFTRQPPPHPLDHYPSMDHLQSTTPERSPIHSSQNVLIHHPAPSRLIETSTLESASTSTPEFSPQVAHYQGQHHPNHQPQQHHIAYQSALPQEQHLPTEGYETWSHNQYELVTYEVDPHVYHHHQQQQYEYPQVSAPPATPYLYPSAVQYQQQPQQYEYQMQQPVAYCDPYTQQTSYYAATTTCPQTPPQIDYAFAHGGATAAVRAVRPQISISTVAGSYAGPYTPVSSNPSSGSNTPQMVHSDAVVAPPQPTSRPTLFPTRYEYVNASESLISPITPSTVATAPNLLLAQPTVHYSNAQHHHHHHQQEATHVLEQCPRSPTHPYSQQSPVDVSRAPVASYTPPSPVSPVIDNPGHSEYLPPTSVDPASTITSPIESPADKTPQTAHIQATVPILKVSTKTASSSLSTLTPEERIQKLRDRRHVVACLFCRGRKIACHPEPSGDSPAGGSGPSRSASPEGYPRTSGSEKRAPCGNCIRRGRECVYPERTPRTSRRRRAREQATAANSVAIAASLQEVRDTARAESQVQPRIRVHIPHHHILPRPMATSYVQ